MSKYLPVASGIIIVLFGAAAQAQQTRYPKPAELPNPYRLVEGWPTLPAQHERRPLGRGHQGARRQRRQHLGLSSMLQHGTAGPCHLHRAGNSNPPILEFNPAGKLLKSFGAGLFAYPHGFTIDREGNLWVSDVNDEATVLGMSAKNAAGVVMGQEVLKLSPAGKVLMTIGKEGVSGRWSGYLRPADRRCRGAEWRRLRDGWPCAQPAQLRPRREIFEGWQVHQGLGT